MPGQSGFLSPRDLVLAEMLEVAASESRQVVAGRRESLEPTTTRRVWAACDRTRFPPGWCGWPFAGFPWVSAEKPRRLVPARKEEVGRRCGIPRQLMRVRAQLLFTSR